ncbi:hypothetical protein EC988_000184, partial [Linderina pennispora]
FSLVWRRGIVVVVRGLLDTLKGEIWKPEWWIKNFGDELVQVLDCKRKGDLVGEWPLKDFYRAFDGDDEYSSLFEESDGWEKRLKRIKRSILKLKDWPPTEGFEERLPDHFRNFMEALPFHDYTSRGGKYNLANQLPEEFVPPDLGPKMYCAYGSSDREGGVGTTNLHCDMADAVNIMAYASKTFLAENDISVPGIWSARVAVKPADSGEPSEGGPKKAAAAVWDIYPPTALENLREYIRAGKGSQWGDPIHNQDRFLTEPDRRKIHAQFGANGMCYRIYQNPGDAVFVPAGSAHQVCNYANAIKVAMDFVSPERVEFCQRMTADFRKLPSEHLRNRDLLQIDNILLWTFAGKGAMREKEKPAKKPPAAASRSKKKKDAKQAAEQPSAASPAPAKRARTRHKV